ncbi:hypothetical protein Dshi_1748 [Dinoroseobacter shibae DFL 12 = DSM 16493]|jgi:hypothetical protein|uniref:VPLPA-CTERM sorting domain-containing protein n=1 Tax=Dinoroseobacter shibae (strain DSM 16493 / NCIMB 14021 / DFL 12) TaxID=398580 RepID=A8LME5_DINSH|nr:VPLPA-CTERM sorting domain-containing protein [Dinoroseobacter shibae]ABV93490.1 hypothetical protein Dshi_1748 [Dinoroseobacter shibae DFL 12 = DSM 16493]URF48401.1 VPLPA-CTERM sorting domain-containing protein [Dinoroseobacter shibae]URF52711.1 VPLPA-CTERM sorting domain-containing protein [Dinoroseobacter shibae]
MSLKTLAAAGAAVALSTAVAHAVTFTGTFDVSGPAFSDPGLVVNVAPNPGPVSFTLSLGDSTTFDLFDIWTEEEALSFPEDTTAQDIFVAFDFTAPPPPFTGTVSGETDGFVFGGSLSSVGRVTWGGTQTVFFGPFGDGVLELTLSDTEFNRGPLFEFGTLTPGAGFGGTVQLTASYITEATPIPLPAAGWLLLAGVGGLGAMRKFRKS